MRDKDIHKELLKATRVKRESIRGLPWQELKKKLVLDALLQAEGNLEEAQRLIGCSRTQLWRYRKEYGLI